MPTVGLNFLVPLCSDSDHLLRELCCQWKMHWKVLRTVNRLKLLAIIATSNTGQSSPSSSSSLLPSPLLFPYSSWPSEENSNLPTQSCEIRKGRRHNTLLTFSPVTSSKLPSLLALPFESSLPDVWRWLPWHKHHAASLDPITQPTIAQHEWCSLAITMVGQDKRQAAHWHTGRSTSMGEALTLSHDATG